MDESAQELGLFLHGHVGTEQVEGDPAHVHLVDALRSHGLLPQQLGANLLVRRFGHLAVDAGAELAIVADEVVVGPAHAGAVTRNAPVVACERIEVAAEQGFGLFQACPDGLVLVQ
ncbi:hypothetical protein D3C78_1152900 [compost metagenome]